MNENRVGVVIGHRYRLEPGDGTRYEFSILGADPKLCTGVGNNGTEYVTLTIHSPGYGSYEVRKTGLRNPARYYAYYLEEHYTSTLYTVMAIALACSVLIEDPENVIGAAKEMLKVPEYLS